MGNKIVIIRGGCRESCMFNKVFGFCCRKKGEEMFREYVEIIEDFVVGGW